MTITSPQRKDNKNNTRKPYNIIQKVKQNAKIKEKSPKFSNFNTGDSHKNTLEIRVKIAEHPCTGNAEAACKVSFRGLCENIAVVGSVVALEHGNKIA